MQASSVQSWNLRSTGEKEENVKKNRYKDILPCKFKMPLKEQMDMLINSFIA